MSRLSIPHLGKSMACDLYIDRYNASYIRLLTEDAGILEDIYQFFRYKEPGFNPDNKWRKSKWDGEQRMFNKATGKLPYGLLQIVFQLCKMRGYTFELDPRFKNDITQITREELVEWIETLELTNAEGEPLVPYDYQIEAVYLSIRYNRMTLLAATSAGKSLIQYILIRYYDMLRQAGENKFKTLLLVPSIHLTHQMFNDFKDYSQKNGWDVHRWCHVISEGAQKVSGRPIYIATWQSIQKEDGDYYEQFGQILVDEAHQAKAKCIKTICENAINSFQKIGLTGTLQNNELHPLMVQGNFGPVQRIVTTKQLQDAGRAAQTQVTRMFLHYPIEDRNLVNTYNYQEEIEFLIGHEQRNKVIKSLAKTLKGNSLFLFDRKDKHQMRILEQLQNEDLGGKKVFVINGDVDGEDRVTIQKITEAETDVIILGSYGTMSTGVSIKHLHNLVFCHPVKSIIRVLQSIGRMIRLHKSKDIANIYDIVDDLETRGCKNTTLDHAEERHGYYIAEQHPVKEYHLTFQKEKITTATNVAAFAS